MSSARCPLLRRLCRAHSSAPSISAWGRCWSGGIELTQNDSGGTKHGTETSPTAHAGRIPQPRGASAPALWEALSAAAGITGEDAQRRDEGRRSGSERWQQALKILLVDASAQLMVFLSSRVGLLECEATTHTDEGESVRSSSWRPTWDPARVQVQQ